MDLCIEKKVVMKECVNENKNENEIRIYPAHYYYMELNTAKMLHDLNISCEISESAVLTKVAAIEKRTGTILDEMQKEAVVQAAGHGLMVLTGGPGTGKRRPSTR